MPKRGKNYRSSLDKLKEKDFYLLNEAIKLLKETGSTKFDSTAELHINLNIDPTKADQTIRGVTGLPHGTGKKPKIAAVVSDDKVKAAKAAGAVSAGLEDLITEFSKGKFDYDIVVAASDVMKDLSKVAKILGQKGLMPNPKSGTVTDDVEKTIKELMAGRVEYRNDKQGIVHTVFGKTSFKEEELENNLKTLLKTIRNAKPSGVKGTFIKSISISSTMGPGIALNVSETLKSL
ncbi:50S ribosomal protein L1 [Patescibacteria group bacterium]|nr:50S ribosomal protein L1 [Patescibacteria group bacterium]MBU1682655.1 50S ribosomal protein L1 [Patescibacteria group bacterium]MBU1934419.1 50S ribosomal protein L1 [Patescibacteria group bacterium]